MFSPLYPSLISQLFRNSLKMILTLASHFLWVAVLHTKGNESSRREGKRKRKQLVLSKLQCSLFYINIQTSYLEIMTNMISIWFYCIWTVQALHPVYASPVCSVWHIPLGHSGSWAVNTLTLSPLQKEPTLSTLCRHTLHCRFFLNVFSLKEWGSPFTACLHTHNTQKSLIAWLDFSFQNTEIIIVWPSSLSLS